jgi:exodeoxyribonuclease VII small subunit
MSDGETGYRRIHERLEEIVVQIRSRDVPLEKSLDLYEEALRLGSMAAEMIDNTDFSDAELAAIDALYNDQVEEFIEGDEAKADETTVVGEAGLDEHPDTVEEG